MSTVKTTLRKGPFRHRLLVWIFTGGLGLLTFWLIGYILRDIGQWPPPDYQAVFERYVAKELIVTRNSLSAERGASSRLMIELQGEQKLLSDGIESSAKTMDQLLELQRLSLEKEAPFPAESQAAMDESLRLFLDNQRKYQQLSQRITEENQKINELSASERENEAAIALASQPAQVEYQQLDMRYRLKVASVKLALLITLLAITAVLFYRKYESMYSPLLFAMGAALAVRVLMVINEYFPAEVFRYVLVLVSLAIVITILVTLLRAVAFPNANWLLKQYREAYTSLLCPVCEFPIRRGPLRFLSWTAKTIRKSVLHLPAVLEGPAASNGDKAREQPYTCPCCGTELYAACKHCQAIRPALLPYCDHCGGVHAA